MKILDVGCLHLGAGKKADDFGDNDKNFYKFVCSQWPDLLILGGDILDSWQEKEKDIRKAHPFFFKEFIDNKLLLVRPAEVGNETKLCKVILINGNHDMEFWKRDSWSTKTNSRKKILFAHGHQGDKLMTNWFIRRWQWLMGKTVERIWGDVDNPDLWWKPNNKNRADKNAEKYARKMLKKYDIVVLAHTHKTKELSVATFSIGDKSHQKIYYNAGTCQHYGRIIKGKHKKFTGVSVDTETDKTELVRS